MGNMSPNTDVPPEITLIGEQRQRIAIATADMIAEAARHFINVVGGLEVIPLVSDKRNDGSMPGTGLQAFPRMRESLVSVAHWRWSPSPVILTYYGFSTPIEFGGAYSRPTVSLMQTSPFTNGGIDISASEKMSCLLAELHAQIRNPKCKPGDVITVGSDPAFPVQAFRLYKAFTDLESALDVASKKRDDIRREWQKVTSRNDPRYAECEQELKLEQQRVVNLEKQVEEAWAKYLGENTPS